MAGNRQELPPRHLSAEPMKTTRSSTGRNVERVRRAVRFTWWLARVLLKLVPPSLEVFLHRRFGDRNFPRMAGSFALFLFYRRAVTFFSCGTSSWTLNLCVDFYVALFLCFGLFHFGVRFVPRFRTGDSVHSYAAGLPWPFWERLGLPPLVVVRFVEPAIGLCLALVISRFSALLGFWLKIASAALFIKGQMDWWTLRKLTLDAMDARIEGRRVNASMEERLATHQPAASRFFTASPARRPAVTRRDLKK